MNTSSNRFSIHEPGPTTTSGDITYADVLALIPRDPTGMPLAEETSARSVQQRLGRGSTATIQKHISSVRAEVAALRAQHAPDAVPPTPAHAAAALWETAYRLARHDLLERHVSIAEERDASLARLQMQEQELLEACSTHDRLRAELSEASLRCQEVDEVRQDLAQQVSALRLEVDELQAKLKRQEDDALATEKLRRAEFEGKIAVLQGQAAAQQEELVTTRALLIAMTQGRAASGTPDLTRADGSAARADSSNNPSSV